MGEGSVTGHWRGQRLHLSEEAAAYIVVRGGFGRQKQRYWPLDEAADLVVRGVGFSCCQRQQFQLPEEAVAYFVVRGGFGCQRRQLIRSLL